MRQSNSPLRSDQVTPLIPTLSWGRRISADSSLAWAVYLFWRNRTVGKEETGKAAWDWGSLYWGIAAGIFTKSEQSQTGGVHGSTFRKSPRRKRRACPLSCSTEGEREPGWLHIWRVTLCSSSLLGLALLCTFSVHKMQTRQTREKVGNSMNRILKKQPAKLRRNARQSAFKKW